MNLQEFAFPDVAKVKRKYELLGCYITKKLPGVTLTCR